MMVASDGDGTQRRSVPTARVIAATVVQRVLADGAYLARVLDAELLRHPQLSGKERGLASELSYGSVRSHGYLIGILEQHTSKKLDTRDHWMMAQLLVAAYQVLLLDRVPASAAVNALVTQVRKKRGPRVAGFANALLRKLARSATRVSRVEAVLASAPDWLKERFSREWGEDELAALLGATDRPAPLVARLAKGHELPDEFASATPCRFAPRSFNLPRALSAEERRAPTWVVQDEGAQLIAWALGVRPGETVLDACAGRGGKALLLAEALGGSGSLWAADVHPHKLETLERDFARLGLSAPRTEAVDWTRGQADIPRIFQRALIDAPCTGSGTLRRRPEILLRLEPQDAARMAQLQEAIVRSVTTRLIQGARVVYAVCSVFSEEAEAVVERVGDILEPAPFDVPALEALLPAGGSVLRLLPGAHGTDGYFLASLRVK